MDFPRLYQEPDDDTAFDVCLEAAGGDPLVALKVQSVRKDSKVLATLLEYVKNRNWHNGVEPMPEHMQAFRDKFERNRLVKLFRAA